MSNFVPNKIIKVVPGDPPWIRRSLKNMLNLGLTTFTKNVKWPSISQKKIF